jgi:U3 small nucleolar RNA-associated protein 6
MAEQVQDILDRMVPALRDLMDREIFTESEVKAIVTRRREYEYLLRRRMPRKSDYARYIEDEKNLEKLRQLRTKKVMARLAAKEREERKTNPDKKPTKRNNNGIGTASIVQHIHLLYVRAKRRWTDDLTWHLQHAEFAKDAKSFGMLGKIYSEALQVHPRNTALWIEAAAHEYFGYVVDERNGGMSGGGSIKSARVLLQRGLRVNPDAQDLWLQSFCLELHYIQKLRGRRELLQIGLKTATNEIDDDSDVESPSLGSTFYKDAKLPRIIYKNAIKSVPNSVEFRLKFIEQCNLFPETETIVNEIMESIQSDFDESEEAWIARVKFIAEKEMSGIENGGGFLKSSPGRSGAKRKHEMTTNNEYKGNTILEILHQAIDSVPTPKMYLESISFLRTYVDLILQHEDVSEVNISKTREIILVGNFLKYLVDKSVTNGISSPQLAIQCASILADVDTPENAVQYITQATQDGECRQNAYCWMKRAELKARVGDSTSACRVLRSATKAIPIHDTDHWIVQSNLFLNLMIQPLINEDELSSIFERLVLLSHRRESSLMNDVVSLPTLALAYVRYATLTGKAIEMIRNIYRKLLLNSTYTKLTGKDEEEVLTFRTFIDECIIAEKNQASSHASNLACLYDSAIRFFDDNGHSKLASSFSRRKENELRAL